MTAARVARRPSWLVFGRASVLLLVVAGAVALTILTLASHPAGITGLGWFALPVLGLLAAGCWLGVGISAVAQRRLPVGLLVTPLVGLLTVGLVATATPSRARFTLLDRAAFETVVARAPAPAVALPSRDLTGVESVDAYRDFPGPCPRHIGSLRIQECATFAAGYLFYDTAGSGVVDDGGVAYLPAGVPGHDVGNGDFESPEFLHLAGPWYAFASSW